MMSSNPPYLPALIAAAGLIGGAYCAYHVFQNKKKLPQNWVQVGTLQHLYTYPIKSCAPIILEQAECTLMGLRDYWLRDRVLMVIDGKKNFITARLYPDMLLVQSSFKGSVLTLTHNDMDPISVNIAKLLSSNTTTEATVWGTSVPVYDCGSQVGEWFSKLLSIPELRLVYYASSDCRPIRSRTNNYPAIFKFTKNDTGALPDETSFNLINESSIEDLNTRLKSPVTHNYFRPNFVVVGAKPLDEDNWKFVKIGDIVFKNIKPCTRCILTTIDPETGVKDSNSEPLITLRSYRLADDPKIREVTGTSPRMGLQLSLKSAPGRSIAIDDPVYVAY